MLFCGLAERERGPDADRVPADLDEMLHVRLLAAAPDDGLEDVGVQVLGRVLGEPVLPGGRHAHTAAPAELGEGTQERRG